MQKILMFFWFIIMLPFAAIGATFDPTKYTKSQWLKAADIPPEGMILTIQFAKEHYFEQSQETKPILAFLESDQKLVLNKTRIIAMIEGLGNDPKQWEGKQIKLTTGASGMGPTIVVSTPSQPTAPVAGEVLFQ